MSIITESLVFDAVAILTTLTITIIAFCKWKLTYWDRLGLPSIPPTIPFGNTKDLFLARKTFGEQFREFYRELKSKGYKHGGVYMGLEPHYLPTDPEILKNIMQRDFQYFVNRGNYINEENDPLTGHLVNLCDAKWKNMRVKLTPTFTSGKMKMMFQTLADCTVGLKDIMNTAASNHAPIDIKDVLGRFTTDIIGSAAFGIDCNSLKDPDAPFRIYGKRVFEARGIIPRVKLLLQFAVPHRILDAIKFRLTETEVEEFFMKVVRDTVDYREKNHIFRKDFMHLLLQLKNRGTVADDDKITDDHGKTQEKALTMNELAAQAFVFFLAGFETSSTTMTFALYEIATHPDIQDKLRQEINEVLKKHNGQMTYEAILEMTYMEKVVQETLRKHPPVPIVSRRCTKDYTLPGTSIVLKRGVNVDIPILALHTDPEYYPDPDKFDPERFSEENKNSRPAFTWIPFGEGPRICIGLRFGMLQSKVGLAALLKNFNIKLSHKTQLPLKLDTTMFITSAESGIWLDVEKVD